MIPKLTSDLILVLTIIKKYLKNNSQLIAKINRNCFFILLTSLLAFPLFAQDNWWNKNWECRRKVAIPSLLGKWEYYTRTAAVYFPNGGKVRKNGEDIRVINEKGKEIPSKVIYSVPYRYSLVAFPLRDNSSTYYIYYGNPRAPAPGYSWKLQAGLTLETRRKPPGRADNWKEMERLISRSKIVYGKGFRTQIFDGYNPYGPSDNYLSIYRGFFYAPVNGKYGFATVSDDASFLFIDSKLVAQWPGFHGAGRGRRAEHRGEIYLKAGVHLIEYYHMEGRGSQACVAAWRKPGDREYRVINERYFLPVTVGILQGYEKRDNPYPADFYYTLLDNLYPEKGILTRLKFSSPSSGFLEWELDDGMKMTGVKEFTHVYLEFKNYRVKLKRKVDVVKLKDGRQLAGYIVSSSGEKVVLRLEGGTVDISRNDIVEIKSFQDSMERKIVLREPLPGNEKTDMENYLKIISLYPLSALSENQLRVLLNFYESLKKETEAAKVIYFLAKKSKGSKRWNYLLTLGNFYQKQGDNTKALLTFQNLAREATGREKCEALLKTGEIFLEKGEFEKAKEIFTGIEKEYSGEWKRKAKLGLGDIYFYQGEFEKAESIYKNSAKEKPGHPEGYYLQRAEYYLKTKDREPLKSTLKEWGDEYPLSRLKFIPYYRGWVYWLAKDYSKAQKEWRLLKEYGKSPLQGKVSSAQ